MNRVSSLVVLFILSFLASVIIVNCDRYWEDNRDWEEYKKKYGKSYDAEEEPKRKYYYMEAKRRVAENNKQFDAGYVPYKLKINHLADLNTNEIFKKLPPEKYKPVNDNDNIPYLSSRNDETGREKEEEELPDSFDWRDKIKMTPVTYQGQCSACWVMAAVGSIEARYTIETNKTKVFSKQILVDCATEPDTNKLIGCNTGTISGAFKYIKNNGLPTETMYPYKGYVEDCRSVDVFEALKLKEFKMLNIGSNLEERLKRIIYEYGPVAVTFDGAPNFEFYNSGVYYTPNCRIDSPTHALLVIGYGTEKDKDFWWVKNSWGEEWGINGFGKVSRNKNNNCGIASTPMYPILSVSDDGENVEPANEKPEYEDKNNGNISVNILCNYYLLLLAVIVLLD